MKKRFHQRAGFTLVESLIALSLLGVLVTITLSALQGQIRLFSSLSVQTDAVQNGRFAIQTFERDLPAAGLNAAVGQPSLVYADSHVVAINADLVSNLANDPFAAYVDVGLSEYHSTAFTQARRQRIPLTSFFYPDTSYTIAGQNSPAETIQFFVEADPSTARNDDYILYRQVNNGGRDRVAEGLLQIPGVPFFEYFRRVTPVGAAPYLEQVSRAQLPLAHVRPIHAAEDDTGALAGIDSLRAVRVNFRVTDGQRGSRERIYTFSRTIPLLNVGSKVKKTCGDEPILGNVNFSAVVQQIDNSPAVRLTWWAAIDDNGGARDVVRYVIYRTVAPGEHGDPYISLPAGEASYSFTDKDVVQGQDYYYYLAAQDCASALSGTASVMVNVP